MGDHSSILILSPSKDELQMCPCWSSSFDGLRMRIFGRFFGLIFELGSVAP